MKNYNRAYAKHKTAWITGDRAWKEVKSAIKPCPRSWLKSSWTFHNLARIKCSPHSPQISKRPVKTQTLNQRTWHTYFSKRLKENIKSLLKITMQHYYVLAHRKVMDPTGVLQQLLKWDGPAQHTVGRARFSTWSPWKAGAAASTTSCRHVQLYYTFRHKHAHYQHRQEWEWNQILSPVVYRHVEIVEMWHVQDCVCAH